MKKTLIGTAIAVWLTVSMANLSAVTDDNWVSMGGFPGVDGAVYATAWRNGALYVGGKFTIAGNAFANCVAKWDGQKWSALGNGLNETVRALVGDASGNLYAGTDKTVSKWDGKKWSVLGKTNASVGALALDGVGNLYVGGSFTKVAGVSAICVAKWDGAAWSALGQGVDNSVRALAVDANNTLYAGGFFQKADGVACNAVARWDGQNWTAMGEGLPDYWVYALAFDTDGHLYAGGGGSSNFTRGVVKKWDGSAWAVEFVFTKTNNADEIRLTNDANGKLYAAYDVCTEVNCQIREKIGENWVSLVSYVNGPAKALACDDSGNFYVGGEFSGINGATFDHVAKWNGDAWETLGPCLRKTGCAQNDSTLPSVNVLIADSSGNLYMGGDFNAIGAVNANYVAKWDGAKWTALGAGVGGVVWALALDAAGNLYVGGEFTAAGDVPANYIAKWDGDAWSALGSGLGKTGESDPSVHAIATDKAGNAYVGGWFETAGGVAVNNIAKWNGTQWSALGAGVGEYGVPLAMACDANGDLYAGGPFAIEGLTSAGIARWDGNAWNSVGKWDHGVTALALNAAGDLYIGGEFSNSEKCYVAKWDNGKWRIFGKTEDYANIMALTFDAGGNLYAGGGFQTMERVVCDEIVKWDGSAWSALVSGISSGNDVPVRALAFDDADNLYVAGSFEAAGDKVSFCLAQCVDPGKPNPATVTVTFAAGANGSIDNPGAQTVKFNGNCRPVKAIPNSGYLFSYWELGGKTYSTANPLTVKNARKDMSLTAIFAAVPPGLLATNMTSSYAETIQRVSYPGGEGGPGYTERSVQSRDKYGFKCVIQMNAGWEALAEGDTVMVTAGDFSQSFALSNVSTDEEIAVCKLGGAKGGSASWTYKEFVETNEETGAGYYATVLKTTLKWTAKGVMTLTVTGSPVPNESANILNLSGSSLGPVFGELDCAVLFGNLANMTFQIPYSGVRSEKIAKWSEEGEPMEQSLESWNVRGTLKIPKR